MSKGSDHGLPFMAVIKHQKVEMLEENSFTDPEFIQGKALWRRGGVVVDMNINLTWS